MRNLTFIFLLFGACIASNSVFDPSQRFYLDFSETCRRPDGSRDFWCEVFCPYFRHLTQVTPHGSLCMYGLDNRLNCSQVTDACTVSKLTGSSWCYELYNLFVSETYVTGKSEEFRSCFFLEEINSPCAKDPECVKWCSALIGNTKSAPSFYKECVKTGVWPGECNDEEACEQFCAAGSQATKNTPDFVFRCAFLGKP